MRVSDYDFTLSHVSEQLRALQVEHEALKEAARMYLGVRSDARLEDLRALLDPPKKPGLREAAEAFLDATDHHPETPFRKALRAALDAEPDWRAMLECALLNLDPGMFKAARRLLDEHS